MQIMRPVAVASRTLWIAGASLLSLAVAATFPVSAQSLHSLKASDKPLVLKARGSFYVGGDMAEQKAVELGGRGGDDRITVNQMYVEYMVPQAATKLPVVMIHGAALSGKTYDTTPDGRMGWFEYFVRHAHPVYVVDQVGRARSGFNQSRLNSVEAAAPAASAPPAFRFGDRNGVWTNFRFGPAYGQTFPDSQFPIEALGEFAKQSIPDLSSLVPSPNPTLKALSALSADLKGAVLISHSQSGHFPIEAALINPAGIRAIVAVEPGRCRSKEYTDAQVAQLAKVPTLIIYGDHLTNPTTFTPELTWQDRFNDCSVYVRRIQQAKGRADLVQTTSFGYRGNSHMLMQDRNSLQIADVILKWIDDNTAGRRN